ncbi:MAG: PspA/IM30 family protein [Bacteroidia bacterium]|nr:PspA/IM30 family protein [Bacteroidia bacterium]MDW8158014.1 PspA/IM30 family protein [Bacteroidia bacterium]
MWKRFIRALKGLLGGAISAIEDPRLILEQNIRELNDQVPKMNQSIATVKASVIQLEKELSRYKAEYNDLVSKIKASIQAGRDDIAANYALRLETIKTNLAKTEEQLRTANIAYQKALEVKEAFMREKDRKIAEAREALRAHERAKWQAKIADTLEQFEVGGIDQTHDEMLRRINEETAKNEARVEMALDSIDTTSMKIEKEAEKLRAMELVKQFKMEMGQINTSPMESGTTESQSEFLQDRNRTL